MEEQVRNDLPVTIYYPSNWGKARVLQDIDQKRYHLIKRKTVQLSDRTWVLEAFFPYRKRISKKTKQSILTMMARGSIINPQFI